jgi:hypothetical protein
MISFPSRPIGSWMCAAWLCAAGLLAGCASTHTSIVGDEDSAADQTAEGPIAVPADLLRNRSLGVRTGGTPSFYAATPGRRTYGILGVIAMMREGNRLVAAYGLEDPVGPLSEDLVATLAIQNRMRTTTLDAADLLLDIKTINWDFRPYRNDPDSLFVVYSARISLIERSSGSVLAQGKCRSRRDREGDSATLDQLLADGARLLQSELREAAHECAQRVKNETLSAFLPTAAPIAQRSDVQPAELARR